MRGYTIDGHVVPLCLQCSAIYESIQDREFARLVAAYNMHAGELEDISGVPVHRIVPPAPPRIFDFGKKTMNNIHINQSTVGALNIDVVGNIDNTISLLQGGGQSEVAEAIQKLTSAVVEADIDDDEKNTALEKLSIVADELAKPEPKRRLNAIRPVVNDLAQWASGISAVAELWHLYGPVIMALFR